jgi:hypothetical protein
VQSAAAPDQQAHAAPGIIMHKMIGSTVAGTAISGSDWLADFLLSILA